MTNLEKTVHLLYSILEMNYRDFRIYSHASRRCKKLLFRNFLIGAADQKKSFCKRIRHEIESIESQIKNDQGNFVSKVDMKNIPSPVLPVFSIEKDGLIKECYRREKQNIGNYQNLLTKINLGNLREMLLFQKHSIQLILLEIEGFGLNIYEDLDEENNEEEMKYG